MKSIGRVHLFEDNDLSQGFDDPTPSFYIRCHKDVYGDSVKLDPFRCYHHDHQLIAKLFTEVEKKFALDFPANVYIFNYEPLSRTNGWATGQNYYDRDAGKYTKVFPYFGLAGKRIPIMPSMSRYLVTHEYGHLVDYSITRRWRDKYDDDNGFRREYADMRGLEFNDSYGCRKWHLNIGEIIANDFRIIMTGQEPEFWPHECQHPLKNKKVKSYWKKLHKAFHN